MGKPLELIWGIVIDSAAVLIDCIDSRITEQRPTQLVPGAFVMESPSRRVCPAWSVPSASLVTTVPDPKVKVEFHTRVYPSIRYLSLDSLSIDREGLAGGSEALIVSGLYVTVVELARERVFDPLLIMILLFAVLRLSAVLWTSTGELLESESLDDAT
jgi:hypothetical protein